MAFSFKTWLCALVIGLLLDFIWIALFARKFYIREFAPIGRITGNEFQIIYWAAILVYVFVGLGISFFVLPQSSNLIEALLKGAVLGLISYGIYDLTNYATLKDWTLKLAAVDIGWGTFLCSAVSGITYWLSEKF